MNGENEKIKSMAQIIEKLSKKQREAEKLKPEFEEKIREIDKKIEFKTQEIKNILTSLEERLKRTGKVESTLKVIDEKLDERIKPIEEALKNLEKISEIEERINKLASRDDEEEIKKTAKALEIEDMKRDIEVLGVRIKKIEDILKPQTIRRFYDIAERFENIVEDKVRNESDRTFDRIVDLLTDINARLMDVLKANNRNFEEIGEIKSEIRNLKMIREELIQFKHEKNRIYEHVDYRISEIMNIINNLKNSIEASFSNLNQNVDFLNSKTEKFREDVRIAINNIREMQKKLEKKAEDYVRFEHVVKGFERDMKKGKFEKRVISIVSPKLKEIEKNINKLEKKLDMELTKISNFSNNIVSEIGKINNVIKNISKKIESSRKNVNMIIKELGE